MALDDDPPDRFPGAPHPRERTVLFGHGAAEAAFLAACAGRLHHAWLIGGPEGIGKATFAYRAARFLLAQRDVRAAARAAVDLGVEAGHGAARRIAARSHPDLVVVGRSLRKDGKAYSAEIAVDDVRRALDLFAATAGEGGFRIAIVDAADDLNAHGANALLKVLEEPPPLSLFLIVSHRPAMLLPTIRSRCRPLALRPLHEDDVAAAVRSLGSPWSDADAAMIQRAASLSHGSVRRALRLLDTGGTAVIDQVRASLARLPGIDRREVLALAETVAGRGSEERFAAAMEVVGDWVGETVRADAAQGAPRLAPLVEVWEKCVRAARDADAFNLDRRPLVLAMFADLAEAVRRSRAA